MNDPFNAMPQQNSNFQNENLMGNGPMNNNIMNNSMGANMDNMGNIGNAPMPQQANPFNMQTQEPIFVTQG